MTIIRLLAAVLVSSLLLHEASPARAQMDLKEGARIAIIGNTLADRMQHDGWFEAWLQTRAPEKKLTVRHLGFSADSLKVRQRNFAYGSPDERLAEVKADVVLLMFGYNESFAGVKGVARFRQELTETIDAMGAQKYNGSSSPQLVIVSPVGHEDLGDVNLPDGKENNLRLRIYRNVMQEIAKSKKLPFVDLFTETLKAYAQSEAPLTINGVHLNSAGNKIVGKLIVDSLLGDAETPVDESRLNGTVAQVKDKNFYWYNYYRTVDGYSMYGRRADLVFTDGQTNREVMRRELDVLAQLTDNRDPAIWAAANGEQYTIDDSNLPEFIPVVTNKRGSNSDGTFKFPPGKEAAKQMKMLDGFKVNLFASEEMFPELINPVQMSFDSKGRLWVAAWQSYPHWKPMTKMDDKLLILEDTDNDGVADECKVFADGLHNPTGFEFSNNGVIVAMAPEILFLEDTDGDDKADKRTMLLHGFDTADTHHAANSFAFGPGGGIYFQEGIFQFSQAETPYGTVRNKDAAIYRFHPRTARLEVYANHPFVNPHGHVFNKWGQDIILDGTMSRPYDGALASGFMAWPKKRNTAPVIYEPRTRPCPAAEIVSSSHFSAEFQDELLVQNVIGDVGILRYKVVRDGSSFVAKELKPLLLSDDPTFRPVDLEFGPRGELFFVDWCNPIIGHMQHNLRDPNRDQAHGRVYRVTQEDRPLGENHAIARESESSLLKLLEDPVERTRYRTRIELSGRDTPTVMQAVEKWIANKKGDSAQELHDLLEALWLHQQHNVLNLPLLDRLIGCDDHRVRAAATRVLTHWRFLIDDDAELAKRGKILAADEDSRVRLEAARLASYLAPEHGLGIVVAVRSQPTDKYLDYVVVEATRAWPNSWKQTLIETNSLAGAEQNAVDWFLNQVEVETLRTAKIDGPIGRHLMFRDGVGVETRSMAIQRVAQTESKKPIDVIVGMLARATMDRPSSSTTRELVGLLAKRPREELTSVRARLQEMSTSGELPVVRQIGFAGSMIADDSPDQSWKTATESKQQYDFVKSLSMIGDPSMQQKVYEKLQPIALASDDERLQRASLEVLASVRGKETENAKVLTDLIANDRLKSTAFEALGKIPGRFWPAGSADGVMAKVLSAVESVPATKRNEPQCARLIKLARTAAELLPAEKAVAARSKIEALGVRTIPIGTQPHRMAYDTEKLVVRTGQPIELVFANTDMMPHNLVITKPGAMQSVGLAAENGGSKLANNKVPFVPDSADVLLASGLVQPAQMEKLIFETPQQAGVYPFVCTYPGHWRRMYGAIYVVDDPAKFSVDPDKYLVDNGIAIEDDVLKIKRTTTEWKLADFEKSFDEEFAEGRNFETGKQMFKMASCISCHQMKGEGVNIGQNLEELNPEYKPIDVLGHILEPSSKIDPKYQTQRFALESGEVISGIVTFEDNLMIRYIDNPIAGGDAKVIRVSNIEERSKSKISIMPTGLVDQLSRSEVFDLLAYVVSNGEKTDKMFSEGHSH